MENRIVENLPHEVWRDVVGYEGQYKVSSLGRVKRIPTTRVRKDGKPYEIAGEILVSQHEIKKGYLRVCLGKKSLVKHFLVHRLVADAFIPNPNNLPQVNHKNSNKQDNRVENLEWCTNEYNYHYGDRLKTFIASYGVPVEQYTMDGRFIQKFEYASLAAKAVGGGVSNIISAARGAVVRDSKGFKYTVRSAYGYRWKVCSD